MLGYMIICYRFDSFERVPSDDPLRPATTFAYIGLGAMIILSLLPPSLPLDLLRTPFWI